MFEQSIVLAFHQTSRRFFPGINNIKPNALVSVLNLLKHWGFTPVETEHQTSAYKPIVLTFDDGYKDNLPVILHLLEMGIKPFVFIPTAYIGQKNSWDYSSRLFPAHHLDAKEIRQLFNAGAIIGSHSHTHKSMTAISEKQLRQELSVSRKLLEDITGRTVDLISFPFGQVNAKVIAVCRDCGYEKGFTLGRSFEHEGENTFLIPRVAIYGNDNYFSLQGKIYHRSRWAQTKNRIINDLANGTIIVSSFHFSGQ